MSILDIPLNRHFGIYKFPEPNEFILGMETDEILKNHAGTLHASAFFGLAEATSGEFLHNEFSKPVYGEVRSTARFYESDRA